MFRLVEQYRVFQHIVVAKYAPLSLLLVFVSFLVLPEKKHPVMVFNYFLLLPALIALPLLIKMQMGAFRYHFPLIIFFLMASVSVFWSGDPGFNEFVVVAKRSLVIFIFVLIVGSVIAAGKMEIVLKALIVVASLVALYSLYDFYFDKNRFIYRRMESIGNLKNPIIGCTVYCFFLLSLAYFWEEKNFKGLRKMVVAVVCAAALLLAALATQSKGPILALFLCLVGLSIYYRDGKMLAILALVIAAVALLVLFQHEMLGSLLDRGGSYRVYIWGDALRQIAQKPWFGHGFNAGYSVVIPDFYGTGRSAMFVSPHNRLLAALYYVGILGAGVLMFAILQPFFVASTRRGSVITLFKYLLVFAFLCGMFQGVNWISRVDEIWLIIWLPWAALVASLEGDCN